MHLVKVGALVLCAAPFVGMALFAFGCTRIEVAEKPAVVLVVGNSFVNVYLGFAQKLSNVLGVPVKAEYLQRATGPWSAMEDVLKASAPPAKYVVWELQETSFSAQR